MVGTEQAMSVLEWSLYLTLYCMMTATHIQYTWMRGRLPSPGIWSTVVLNRRSRFYFIFPNFLNELVLLFIYLKY